MCNIVTLWRAIIRCISSVYTVYNEYRKDTRTQPTIKCSCSEVPYFYYLYIYYKEYTLSKILTQLSRTLSRLYSEGIDFRIPKLLLNFKTSTAKWTLSTTFPLVYSCVSRSLGIYLTLHEKLYNWKVVLAIPLSLSLSLSLSYFTLVIVVVI